MSLGAVVLDLFPTFLQRLHENVHIFVGFDPNQFFWQVDFELYIYEQQKQKDKIHHTTILYKLCCF